MLHCITNACFGTAADGARLFFPWGCLSRAYIVPDAATERRLARRLIWAMVVCFGLLALSAPVLIYFLPQVFSAPAWAVGFLLLFVAGSTAVTNLMLRPVVCGLARTPRPLTAQAIYSNLAKGSALRTACLGLLSLAWCVGSAYSIAGGVHPIIALIGATFCGVCSVGAAYTLFLKYRSGA